MYLVSHTGPVVGLVEGFVEKVRAQHGTVPVVVRSDRGQVYVIAGLETYLRSSGIPVRSPAPCSPQRGGVAGGRIGYLFWMTGCMLLGVSFEKGFWGKVDSRPSPARNPEPRAAAWVQRYHRKVTWIRSCRLG